MYIDSDGSVTLLVLDENRAYKIHGIIMYTSWSILSLLQISLNRYLGHLWRWRLIAHSIVGTLALILTTYAAYDSISHAHIQIEKNPHEIMGLVTLGVIGVMGTLGLTSAILRTGWCCNMDWKTSKLIFVTKMHKYFAYFLIVGSQATISSGIMNFYTFKGSKDEGIDIITGTNLGFFAILITLEMTYRMRRRQEVEFEADEDLDNITKAEFHEMVHN